MKYNQLRTTKQRSASRVGRGISAGKGRTAGRGTKGQNARSGGGVRPGFEGGQNPLTQRLPKLPGFRSIHKKAEIVLTSQLNNFRDAVDNAILCKAGLITDPYARVKIVFNGPITKKLHVSVQAASKRSVASIVEAGGSFTKVAIPKRPAKKTTQ